MNDLDLFYAWMHHLFDVVINLLPFVLSDLKASEIHKHLLSVFPSYSDSAIDKLIIYIIHNKYYVYININ